MKDPKEVQQQICAWGSLLVAGLGLAGLVFPATIPFSTKLAAILASAGCLGQAKAHPVRVRGQNKEKSLSPTRINNT